jgi:NAD(P)-dependent dehydrogenase (short-subunit alcohol dehydrogenase family)
VSAYVAIVAGAGGALGHATTATRAARGLTVVAVDRNDGDQGLDHSAVPL